MKKIPGLIVTYNPSSVFFSNLDAFYTQFEQLIIVDNGSDLEPHRLLKIEAQKRNRSLTVLFNKSNLGVATALNQGFQRAIEQGHRQVIAFDQDSQPAPGMMATLYDVFTTHSKDGRLAVVAPIVTHPTVNVQARYLRPKNRFLFERVSCDEISLENVTYVITSGALYDLAAYQEVGPFRDDFFIDYVDIEYCLRARENGYRIVVACNAYLHHHLGDQQQRRFLGRTFYPTFHSVSRWYYINRNRTWMLKWYAIKYPYWLFFELSVAINSILRMLLFEDQRVLKIRAILLGTLDGLLGRMEIIPDSIKKLL
jgi:rhamnosyltransferase